jgi:hypothetical protein
MCSDHCLTPKIPDDCPPLLRQLMQLCWKKEPDQRPVSFILFLFSHRHKRNSELKQSLTSAL